MNGCCCQFPADSYFASKLQSCFGNRIYPHIAVRFVEKLNRALVFDEVRSDDRHITVIHEFIQRVVFLKYLQSERFKPSQINDIGYMRGKVYVVRADENIHVDFQQSFFLRRLFYGFVWRICSHQYGGSPGSPGIIVLKPVF